MRADKKSSEWELFVDQQHREHRVANPRSWAWLKALVTIVAGLGLGLAAYALFGRGR